MDEDKLKRVLDLGIAANRAKEIAKKGWNRRCMPTNGGTNVTL